MAIFFYKARNRFGESVSGEIDSSSREVVASYLDSLGCIPISIKEKKVEVSFIKHIASMVQKVKDEELLLFCRQMHTLITAGIPITQGLVTVGTHIINPYFKTALDEIRREIEGGGTFSGALSRHPKVFSPLFVSMTKAGEEAGMLDEIFERLSFLMEKDIDTKARIKAAVFYPIIVICAIIIAAIILLSFVIPRFAKLFESFKTELPFPTRMLIGINNAVQEYWYLLVMAVVAVFVSFRAFLAMEDGRLAFDRFKLRVPIFGELATKIVMSRFALLTSLLYRSGVPIVQSLGIVADTMINKVVKRDVLSVLEAVKEGKGLVEPMKVSASFSPMVIQMVEVGEKSGNLDGMLLKVNEYYDREADYIVKRLSARLEPILLVIIGIVVLFLALAVFLPMWDMARLYKR